MKRDFSKCPRCGSRTVKAKAYSGATSEFWRECTGCHTYINTYIPQDHQEAFHKDPHRYKGNFGGLMYWLTLNCSNCWDTQTGQSAAKLQTIVAVA